MDNGSSAMRRVYRFEGNEEYWDRRWRDSGEDAEWFTDISIYPIVYAESVVRRVPGRILEIGCGLGRVVKHFHHQGREIIGLERSAVAVERIKKNDKGINVQAGDASSMPFADGDFDIVLAFGVYHNFENGILEALAEAARVLKTGGYFVISMRPDNWEMNFNEWYWRWRYLRVGSSEAPRRFHKVLVREREFVAMLQNAGLAVDRVYRARNMSILFRLPFLQSGAARRGEESTRRSAGYRLNAVGRALDRILMRLLPGQFCNVLVFEGRKVCT